MAGLARLAGLLVAVLFVNDIDRYLQEEAEAVLDEQETKIQNLTEQLAECKELYLADLNDTLDDLNARQDDLLESIAQLANLTDSRKCEYFKLKGWVHFEHPLHQLVLVCPLLYFRLLLLSVSLLSLEEDESSKSLL